MRNTKNTIFTRGFLLSGDSILQLSHTVLCFTLFLMLKLSLETRFHDFNVSERKNREMHAVCGRVRAEAAFVVLPSVSETFRV